ncbi:MAG: hypothetical protein AB7V58_13250 [Solirubrobacterales bacterium]
MTPVASALKPVQLGKVAVACVPWGIVSSMYWASGPGALGE